MAYDRIAWIHSPYRCYYVSAVLTLACEYACVWRCMECVVYLELDDQSIQCEVYLELEGTRGQ